MARNTRQRSAVLDALVTSHRALTAPELCAAAQQAVPGFSLRRCTGVSRTCRTKASRSVSICGATVGGKLYSDALSPPRSAADTYLTLLEHNATTIAAALRGEPKRVLAPFSDFQRSTA